MTASIQLQMKQRELSHENASQYVVAQERVILELAMRTAERIIGAND